MKFLQTLFTPFKYHKAKLVFVCKDDEVEGKRRSEKRNLKLNFSSLSFAHARRKILGEIKEKFKSFSYFLSSSPNDNDIDSQR